MNNEIKKDLVSNWFKLLQDAICDDITKLEKNNINLNFSNKIKELYLEHLPAKDAAKLIAALSNQNKREVYKWLIDK